ncbi:MAG: biotin/lipoyl-binding protein [Planctomycetota bacterium]|nr:biotin/lipoyl-binding protein [Planctomycetota bacterium]
MSDNRTFSESWYRIANEQVCLRAHVKVRRQYFRGEKWFVLYDPFSNQFFRLSPAAYDFVARLSSERTVEEVWKESLTHNPDEAPGQEDVLQILSQLHHTSLLQYRSSGDTNQLFERYQKRRQKEISSTFMNIMFARIPLWDPDEFLKRTKLIGRFVFGPFAALFWAVVVVLAGKLAIENADILWDQRQGVLAPGNLALLYLAFAFTKAFHELGHAYVCRRYGGEVHTMGIMLLVFTPVPFVDATAAWSFRSKWQRIYVGAAGMLVEIFIAAIAVFVWANTGPGMIHSLAYNVMITASVSTIIFNANPLLRFDGYYILSDALDIPNLHPRSSRQLSYWFEKFVFGYRKSLSPANTTFESWNFGLFGVCSQVYRVYISFHIIIFVMNRYLLIGAIMALVCLISWVITPLGKLLHYLATSPKLERTRFRAICMTACLAMIVLTFLGLLPFPNYFKAPGILRAHEYSQVTPDESGYVKTVLVKSGKTVQGGQPLLILESEELDIQLRMAEAQYRQSQILARRSLDNGSAELKSILAQMKSVRQAIERLKAQQRALTVRAEFSGTWIAPDVDQMEGVWIQRGQRVGHIVNESSFEFVAIVAQDEVSRLFEESIQSCRIRLQGEAGREMVAARIEIIPGSHTQLPSAALGYSGGGDVPVDMSDPSGARASESFFQVKAGLPWDADARLLHGRSGKIRFDLPSETLASQWLRKLRQLLQKRGITAQA